MACFEFWLGDCFDIHRAQFVSKRWFCWIEPKFSVSTWLIWLLPALLAIFIQTFAEELIFRGYLQQKLTAIIAGWLRMPRRLWE